MEYLVRSKNLSESVLLPQTNFKGVLGTLGTYTSTSTRFIKKSLEMQERQKLRSRKLFNCLPLKAIGAGNRQSISK